jgi:hypothetical protein
MAHQCHYCSNVFKTTPLCYQHARLAHKEIIQKSWISCPNCKKYFPNKGSLISHKRYNCLVCDYCNKLLMTRSQIRNHVEQNHLEEMSKHWTKCSACDKKFRVGQGFSKHWSHCQQNQKDIYNNQKDIYNVNQIGCRVSKTSHSSVNDQAGPDNYNAELGKPPNCTTNYEYKLQLINGIMAYHCQFANCTEFYQEISSCYRHARLAHNEAVQKYWIPCPNCQKYFPNKGSLIAHTSVNCFGCKQCNKVLNSRNEQRSHVEQNHPEEMSKYWTKCLVCDEKFQVGRSFSCHLKQCQQRNHTEEISWTKCKACDKQD